MSDQEQQGYDVDSDWRAIQLLGVRLRYCSLLEPRAFDSDTKEPVYAKEQEETEEQDEQASDEDAQQLNYDATILMPKRDDGGSDIFARYMGEDDVNALDAMFDMRHRFLTEALGDEQKAQDYHLNMNNWSVVDGDLTNKEQFKGVWRVKGKTRYQPLVIGKYPELYTDKTPEECWKQMRKDGEEPYPGCYVNVLFTFYWMQGGYMKKIKRTIPSGIYARLSAIQFVDHGPEFAQGKAKPSVFRDARTEDEKAAAKSSGQSNGYGGNSGNKSSGYPGSRYGSSGGEKKSYGPSKSVL